jgi:hypothetical protein
MTLLASPGAPGWTIGGAAPPDDARQAAPIAAASRHAAAGNHNVLICSEPPFVTLPDRGPHRNWRAVTR